MPNRESINYVVNRSMDRSIKKSINQLISDVIKKLNSYSIFSTQSIRNKSMSQSTNQFSLRICQQLNQTVILLSQLSITHNNI